MKKPTYYLWRDDYKTTEEYNKAKEMYSNLGFRVVTYIDGKKENDIHQGIKAMVKNYFKDISC